MNISKFKLFVKLINPFGGFASAFEYVVGCLNTWLASVNVAANVAKTVEVAKSVYKWMIWLGKLCPAKWSVPYAKTCKAVETLIDALADGQLSVEEVNSTAQAFQLAYAGWMANDVPATTLVSCEGCADAE